MLLQYIILFLRRHISHVSSPLRDPSQEEPESLLKETTSTLAALLQSTLGVTLVTSKSEYCSSTSSVFSSYTTNLWQVHGMKWYIWRDIGDNHSVKCIWLEIIQNINKYSAHLCDSSVSPSCDLPNNKAKALIYIKIVVCLAALLSVLLSVYPSICLAFFLTLCFCLSHSFCLFVWLFYTFHRPCASRFDG